MFTHSKSGKTSGLEIWKEKRKSEQISKKRGETLRHLSGKDDFTSQCGAMSIIRNYGDDATAINKSGRKFYTPIFKSVMRGNFTVTHELMHAPALDVNLKDVFGFNILMHALRSLYPDHELIQYLLSRPDIDLAAKTYEDTISNRMQCYKMQASKLRIPPLWRGASALFFATEQREYYEHIPMILKRFVCDVNSRVDCDVNDRVECLESHVAEDTVCEVRRAPTANQFYFEYRSPLTNLVKAIGQCDSGQHLMLLECIEVIATSTKHSTHRALLLADKMGDKQVIDILLRNVRSELRNSRSSL